MQSNETTTSAMGEEGEKEEAAQEGRTQEVWCAEEKHIHNSLDPSKGTRHFNDNQTLAFMESET